MKVVLLLAALVPGAVSTRRSMSSIDQPPWADALMRTAAATLASCRVLERPSSRLVLGLSNRHYSTFVPPWARRLGALGAAPVILATLDAHTQRVAREVAEIGCAVPFYASAASATGSRERRRLAVDYGRARSRLAELEVTELAKYTLIHLLLGRGHASVTFSEMDVLWFAPGPWEALAAAAAAAPPAAWLHGLDNHPASAGMVNLGFLHALPSAAPFFRDAAERWAAELAASPEAGREVRASCASAPAARCTSAAPRLLAPPLLQRVPPPTHPRTHPHPPLASFHGRWCAASSSSTGSWAPSTDRATRCCRVPPSRARSRSMRTAEAATACRGPRATRCAGRALGCRTAPRGTQQFGHRTTRPATPALCHSDCGTPRRTRARKRHRRCPHAPKPVALLACRNTQAPPPRVDAARLPRDLDAGRGEARAARQDIHGGRRRGRWCAARRRARQCGACQCRSICYDEVGRARQRE